MKLPWSYWMEKLFQQRIKESTTEIKPRHIHLIAVGGAAMHNVAIALQQNGFKVTGSDDEIYNPSRQRLENAGLLPDQMGWNADRITTELEAVIVGMHARPDNPELLRAQELGVKVYSYPEFVYEQSVNKKRVVVGGSHGKTSTTAMILHVLRRLNWDVDYLVGAQLEGFHAMVQLSDAPIIIIEGDEYLSSPIVREPKFHFYRPHLAILTGIAWDHINVFPTFEHYVDQFKIFVDKMMDGGYLAYYQNDRELIRIAKTAKRSLRLQPYEAMPYRVENGKTIVQHEGKDIELQIFGDHNMQNLQAAKLVCLELGVEARDFYRVIQTFKGAAKRLELLLATDSAVAYKDFAHAPSKVAATINALKAQYPNRQLVACFELHTFSSLNKHFLKEYHQTMNAADVALVYFSEHTLKMKRLPAFSTSDVLAAFQHPNMQVFTDASEMLTTLAAISFKNTNLLMMSSGTFDKTDLEALAKRLLEE